MCVLVVLNRIFTRFSSDLSYNLQAFKLMAKVEPDILIYIHISHASECVDVDVDVDVDVSFYTIFSTFFEFDIFFTYLFSPLSLVKQRKKNQ